MAAKTDLNTDKSSTVEINWACYSGDREMSNNGKIKSHLLSPVGISEGVGLAISKLVSAWCSGSERANSSWCGSEARCTLASFEFTLE